MQIPDYLGVDDVTIDEDLAAKWGGRFKAMGDAEKAFRGVVDVASRYLSALRRSPEPEAGTVKRYLSMVQSVYAGFSSAYPDVSVTELPTELLTEYENILGQMQVWAGIRSGGPTLVWEGEHEEGSILSLSDDPERKFLHRSGDPTYKVTPIGDGRDGGKSGTPLIMAAAAAVAAFFAFK
jgi:hypothetical protein